jgi:hypothetical protein
MKNEKADDYIIKKLRFKLEAKIYLEILNPFSP